MEEKWGGSRGGHDVDMNVAGGMRIQVPRSQVPQAREIISAWDRGELAIDDVADQVE